MSYTLKKLMRDRLVNDATIRTLLNVTTTGSAPVSPVFMEQSGVYPRITYSEIDGPTDPGMTAENGLVTFHIEVQATGGAHPHKTYEDILDRIRILFDDQSMSGTAISGTGAYCFLFLREGGPECIFDEQRKTYSKLMSYSYKIIQG